MSIGLLLVLERPVCICCIGGPFVETWAEVPSMLDDWGTTGAKQLPMSFCGRGPEPQES